MHDRQQSPLFAESMLFLQQNYRSPISLRQLADIAGYTPTSYVREFTKRNGVPPIRYLTRLRIDSAKRLLADRGQSVRATASAVGYGSEFHFSRQFKKQVGIPPSLYMRRSRLRVALFSSIPLLLNMRSLGVEPVLSADCHHYTDMSEVSHAERCGLALRQLEQLRPDLVVMDRHHVFMEAACRTFAPTAVLELPDSWRQLHMRLAEWVGRETDAARDIERTEQHAFRVREQLRAGGAGHSILLVRCRNNALRIQGTSHHPLNDLIYGDLGLKAAEQAPRGNKQFERRLDDLYHLRSDFLFVLQRAQTTEDRQALHVALSAAEEPERRLLKRRLCLVSNWAGLSWSPSGRKQIIDEVLTWRQTVQSRR